MYVLKFRITKEPDPDGELDPVAYAIGLYDSDDRQVIALFVESVDGAHRGETDSFNILRAAGARGGNIYRGSCPEWGELR